MNSIAFWSCPERRLLLQICHFLFGQSRAQNCTLSFSPLSLSGAFVFVFVFQFQFVFLYHREHLDHHDHHDHHHHHDDLDHHDHLDQLTESVWSSWRSTKGRNLTALSFPLLCKYHEEPQSTIKYNKIPQSTTNYRKVSHCTTSSKKCPIMLKGTYWLLNKSFLKSLWLCKHRGNNRYHPIQLLEYQMGWAGG